MNTVAGNEALVLVGAKEISPTAVLWIKPWSSKDEYKRQHVGTRLLEVIHY